jgi:hypothetical protein
VTDGGASLWDATTRLRASPAYAVVSRDALPPALGAIARELEASPELYGVALPHDPTTHAPKALDCDTALLLLSLREPGLLPWFARARLGHRAQTAVETLILDGVLEVERAGAFLSGAQALGGAAVEAPEGPLARVSHAALAYGAALAIDDPAVLARRLYGYHRIPLSPAWRAALPDHAAVERHLGLHAPSTRRALEGGWTAGRPPAPGVERHWHWWRPRRRTARRADAGYKLYVSCAPERLGDALGTVVEVLARSGGAPFKVGANAEGVLRPDKLVIYLDRLAAVFELGTALREALWGVPAHGVPFTGPVTGDGLLSWGIDPSRGADAAALHGGRSWRARVTTLLARSIVAARRQGAGHAATGLAIERIRRAGVDPETWAPRSHEWEAAADD